ncbi:MAG: TIGR04282 family arsenosugar biosynthesis glycosyltransferase [Acidobacteria bacterium]|nr:TIGR04282 family arsenosugar biosynthesis glycosyltransferase [Acidobacteriota bacterium]
MKTRLQPCLTADEALALHIACLEDLCEKLAALKNGFEIYCFLSEEVDSIPERCRTSNLRIQAPGDLGRRMQAAAEHLFDLRHDAVIFLGSDTPHLDPKLLFQAIDSLQDYEVVIGPSQDGGYYLLALKQPHQKLFRNINWGSEKVLSETLERLRRRKTSFALLEESFDLDRPSDLKRFMQSEARIFAPRTFALLKGIEIKGYLNRDHHD